MEYIGDIYRPPSEARSFILQVTVGCAHNTCTFCSMYKDKHFAIRPQAEILADIDEIAQGYPVARANAIPREHPGVRRVFLADGDALVLPTSRLLEILEHLKIRFPQLERVTSYATVHDILRKSDAELRALRQAGLDMLYIGLESGSDRILKEIRKDQTQEDYLEACAKAKRAGLRLSVTLIFGLGETAHSDEHIDASAKAISLSKPDFVSFLTLHLSPGAPLYEAVRDGRFTLIDDDQILDEMRRFVSQVDSEGTVFRSNHASNPVPIAGTFNADRTAMLEQIDRARERHAYRPRFWRQL